MCFKSSKNVKKWSKTAFWPKKVEGVFGLLFLGEGLGGLENRLVEGRNFGRRSLSIVWFGDTLFKTDMAPIKKPLPTEGDPPFLRVRQIIMVEFPLISCQF